MAEMLAVLAVIGVLTIGGLAGYKGVQNKITSNRVLDEAISQGLDLRLKPSLRFDGEQIRYGGDSQFIESRVLDAKRENLLLTTKVLFCQ